MFRIVANSRHALLLSAVCLAGVLVSLQGWKARATPPDLATRVEAAGELIAHGRIPQRAAVGSYVAFTPPGSVWLTAPGMLLCKDSRLFESVSSVALYAGTVVGIFLVARLFFGTACGLLAAVLFALSSIGLKLGESFGHPPFFYVWMVYFLSRWTKEKEAKHLVLAVLFWAVGFYIFMEVAPAFFIIPVLWFIRRPPVRSGWWIPVAAVLALMWLPYLRFEANRGFIDMRAQALCRRLVPTQFRNAMCDPLRPLEEVRDRNEPKISSQISELTAVSSESRKAGIVHNFDQVAGNAFTAALLLLAFIGVSLLLGLRERSTDVHLLLLSLLIPWFVLILLPEPLEGVFAQRFYWLWPLQAVFLAAFAAYVPARYRAHRVLSIACAALVFTAVSWNPVLLSKVSGWRQSGWAGHDSPMVQAVDFIAAQIKAAKLSSPSIGYELFFGGSQMSFAALDPNYRVGAAFDLLLRTRHGIGNANRCIEGLAGSDQFRVVQNRPEGSSHNWFFKAEDQPGLELVAQFDNLDVESMDLDYLPNSTTASLSGLVVSSAVQPPFVTVSPIPDAAVSLRGSAGFRTSTLVDGHYLFAGVPKGTYRLEVTRPGFAPYIEIIAISSVHVHRDVTLPSLIKVNTFGAFLSPTIATPGSSINFVYSITNNNAKPVLVALGGCLYQPGATKCPYGNPEPTDVVAVAPGTATYTRKYILPADMPSGDWDLSERVWGNPPHDYHPLFDGTARKYRVLKVEKNLRLTLKGGAAPIRQGLR
jgi:hypothetical protein